MIIIYQDGVVRTVCLIDLWGEESVQFQIEGCARNREVYEKLAEQMRAAGYSRTGVQCRDKIKKLKTEYKKIKDNNNKSGRARRSMRIFEAMDRILGHRPATRPLVLLDTLSVAQDDVDHQAGDVEASVGFDGEGSLLTDSFILTSSREESSSSTPASSVCSSEVSVAGNSQGMSASGKKPKGLKRQQSRNKGHEGRMKDMMDTVMTSLREMKEAESSLLAELEAKRMKYEDSRQRGKRV